MNLEELNTLVSALSKIRLREAVFDLAFALIEWMGFQPVEEKRPRLLSPQTQKLKDYLIPVPLTVQPQLYRLTAEGQPVRIRFAALKKLRKEYINQLVDNDPGLTSYQASVKGIVNLPDRPAYIPSEPYFIHFITPSEYDKLILVFNQGDQKRIITFRNKLTQTQYYRIVQQWKDCAVRSKPELADLFWKSLDVKEVNKEFYRKIKERFDDLVGLIQSKQGQLDVNHLSQFVIRLIGRYLFCWFLKEKGIIPAELICSSSIAQNKPGYYQKFLLRLFFQTLNTEVQQRNFLVPNHPLDPLFLNIPYLDGGLFEDLTEDRQFHQLVTDDWLIDLVTVLESYDFTVDESSMQYQQVAIDPEMLGRIFENLLASQNPETEKLANQRKAFGAFYTPREIVEYMVDASLKAYLEQALAPNEKPASSRVNEPVITYSGTLFHSLEPRQTEILLEPQDKYSTSYTRQKIVEKIDRLFVTGCDTNPFDKRETQIVQHALRNIRVLDPACGSGAFPICMLLRLMNLREIVGSSLNNPYELKSEILSRNIYGVDIMPMAVEIARLRAWLSLVLEVEYKPADRKHNFNIKALPNLDFKFICANSLIDSGYDAFIEKFRAQIQMADSKAYQLKTAVDHLQHIRNEYYDTRGDKLIKDELQEQFIRQKEFIKTAFEGLRKNWNLEDFLNKVDDWNPFDDSHASSFFSPGWMFGINAGFDVVIGNPPYVQIQKMDESRKQELEDQDFETFERTGDLYQIFYEQGIDLLKDNGVISYITSNKWMRTNYGAGTRNLFSSRTSPVSVIDFGMALVFESATILTNIYIATKNGKEPQIPVCRIREEDFSESTDLAKYFSRNSILIKNPGEQSWIAYTDQEYRLIRKIEQQGMPLNEWNIKINRGILTGYNAAFIIGKDSKDRLIAEDPGSAGIIRPILRGEDIKAYVPDYANLFLIATFPALEIDINSYPAVRNYLEQLRNRIEPKPKNYTGGKWHGRKAGSYKWFETQDTIAYYEDFDKPKIIYPNMTKFLPFSYDENNRFVCNDKAFIITGEYLLYLTGILNSSLWRYAFKERFPELLGDTREVRKVFFQEIPIKKPVNNYDKLISIRVEQVIRMKTSEEESDAIEKEIDVLVYRLYNLTYDEVRIIDPDFWLSEEEYNKVNVL